MVVGGVVIDYAQKPPKVVGEHLQVQGHLVFFWRK